MEHTGLVRAFFRRLEEGDVRGALRLCDRDLGVVAPGHQVLGGRDFEQVVYALGRAFPDLRWELHDLVEEAGVITGTMDISGTHTRDLEIPMWGLPVVPASGRRVVLRGEPLEVLVVRGKIRRVGSSLQGARGALAPVQVLGIELSRPGLLG